MIENIENEDLVEVEHQGMESFTFGDPVPVLEQWEALYWGECNSYKKWYAPPYDPDALSRTMRATSHHSSPIYVKRNILSSTFVPHKLLSTQDFSRLALDYLTFGNSYLERVNSRSRKAMKLNVPLSKYMRVGTDGESFYFVTHSWTEPHIFKRDNFFHLIEPDINQEIYGAPEYLAALNAAWLDESATLFRRKYYLNGSHAGYILYISDPAQNKEDIDKIRTALKNSKGPGNFRNLFLYSPNGKKDGIQILPISEVSANDDFFKIKEASRIDIAAAHRVPPQLMGAMPTNTGGFGDVTKAAKVFVINELHPLQQRFLQINEWLGEEVIKFKEYELIKE